MGLWSRMRRRLPGSRGPRLFPCAWLLGDRAEGAKLLDACAELFGFLFVAAGAAQVVEAAELVRLGVALGLAAAVDGGFLAHWAPVMGSGRTMPSGSVPILKKRCSGSGSSVNSS